MNITVLVGHVGAQPQARLFSDTGNRLVKFSIAVKEYSPNTDKPRTLWFEIDAWNGIADRVLKLVTTGREVVAVGRMSLNIYTKEVKGEKIQITRPVLKLTSFHLVGAKPKDSDGEAPEEPEIDAEELARTVA